MVYKDDIDPRTENANNYDASVTFCKIHPNSSLAWSPDFFVSFQEREACDRILLASLERRVLRYGIKFSAPPRTADLVDESPLDFARRIFKWKKAVEPKAGHRRCVTQHEGVDLKDAYGSLERIFDRVVKAREGQGGEGGEFPAAWHKEHMRGRAMLMDGFI